ncbi:MAG: FAD:protein FMN transferase, partial [Gammaproteobacteria bacterium]|nr:FAD:protein FMN transferase [Gammaproteobacteria bacterium]
MGTIVEITIFGVAEPDARQAAKEVETVLLSFDRDWYPWGDGIIGKLNRALNDNQAISVEPDILLALQKAGCLYNRSQRLFDPTIGPLIELWQFQKEERPPAPPPAAEAIVAALTDKLDYSDLKMTNRTVSSPKGPMTLDFGGFAKGLAVDIAIKLLAEKNINNVIVNAGGDLRARGRRGERAWRIGIRNPRGPGIIAAVEVRDDESIFTSGDYERYFEYEGKKFHHILDPRSGYPADKTVSVT